MEDMPAKYTKAYPAKKIDVGGKTKLLDIPLACEAAIEVYLDGKRFTTLLASPAEFKELAAGHLVTEGILSFEEISGIEVQENRVEVRTKRAEGREGEYLTPNPLTPQAEEKAPYIRQDATFEAKAVFEGREYLESGPYRLSRGTHLAALVDRNGKLIARSIDVGRHNAVDKIVGKAFLEGLPLSELYLLSTGRQPAYMVVKAARAGIPLIVTKAMPLDSGVEAARKTNMGLVGKLSEDSMLVFANDWRIKV